VGLYERALAALDHLSEGPERDRQAIDLALELRAPLWRLGRLERLFALFQAAEGRARRIGYAETVWRLSEELAYVDRLRSVTSERIRTAARRYLDPARGGRLAFVPPAR